ncbi:MAG: hypothetical protein M1834_000533 [Cirrosporium novae-zelandiae]|nr:MAG: hypothetical protein M1834_000533 [Cirrosporium novae-zelandiae]
MTNGSGPLYLGFDLSTQQLKGVVVDSDLKVVDVSLFDFDAESKGFAIEKGVMVNEAEHEVFAPVALWLQAFDHVLQKFVDKKVDVSRIRGISGAGQQHGSVFWSAKGEELLKKLDPSKGLQEQLVEAFAHPYSPNWQDASTQKECDEFDVALGNPEALAQSTGSKAHHRFTGPQILRLTRKHPEAYKKTARISLVSSFVASVLLGAVAPIDISDVCGMDLWNINGGKWDEKLLELASGSISTAGELKQKLGKVHEDGGYHLGHISPYFVKKYGFSPECTVVPSTGDNPATIIALPLRPLDAMVSLGTSTTFLMSTPEYRPDPAYHFFNHPTTAGLYMFMLCYKNGGLAREHVRDAINKTTGNTGNVWADFDKLCLAKPPLGTTNDTDLMKMALYFSRPEIVPNLPAGEWHFNYDPKTGALKESLEGFNKPDDDARTIVESQFLSCRFRSQNLVHSPAKGLPPQPRRVYLVGGGSRNKAIAKLAGEIFGGSEGVFKLEIGENACALGAAYKAVWAIERKNGEKFEDLVGKRWKEEDFVEKIADGYQPGVFEKYGKAVEGFAKMEAELLERRKQNKI